MNATLEAMAQALFKSWFADFEPVRAKMAGHDTGLPPSIATLFPGKLARVEARDVPVGWHTGTLAEVAIARRQHVVPTDCGEETPYIGLEHMPRRSIALGSWGFARAVKSAKSRFQKGDILFGKLRPYFHKVGTAPVDGVCSGTRMPRTSWKTTGRYAIGIPPSQLAFAYQQVTQPALDKTVVNVRSSRTLASLRDALLPKLVSGELRVPDAERIVEAVA